MTLAEAIRAWRELPSLQRKLFLAVMVDGMARNDVPSLEQEMLVAVALLKAAASPEQEAPRCARCDGLGEIQFGMYGKAVPCPDCRGKAQR